MSCYPTEPDPFPSPRPGQLRIEAAARSDPGLVRTGNEDRAVFADAVSGQAWEPPSSISVVVGTSAFWAVVCDGMGGEAGGEIASDLGVRTIAGAMRRALPASTAEAAIVASIETAAARIKDYGAEHRVYARMGTTATLAVVVDSTLVVGQVGDSRGYVFSGSSGALAQVTRDQTLAEMMRASGVLPIDADGEPVGAHVILQALGSSKSLDVVISRTPLEPGDVVLLCSDGLHGVVSDERIAMILERDRDLAVACESLVVAAKDGGAPDNVTCVLFRVTR